MSKKDDDDSKDFPPGPTSEFEKLLEKAMEIAKAHQKAQAKGVKLGTLQDFGIFLGPDAAAHIKNKRFPMFTMDQWESMTRKAHDKVTSKGIFRYLPPGAGIDFFYNDRQHLLAEAKPEELQELWDDHFRMYPKPDTVNWSKQFRESIDAERQRRAAADGKATTNDPNE